MPLWQQRRPRQRPEGHILLVQVHHQRGRVVILPDVATDRHARYLEPAQL